MKTTIQTIVWFAAAFMLCSVCWSEQPWPSSRVSWNPTEPEVIEPEVPPVPDAQGPEVAIPAANHLIGQSYPNFFPNDCDGRCQNAWEGYCSETKGHGCRRCGNSPCSCGGGLFGHHGNCSAGCGASCGHGCGHKRGCLSFFNFFGLVSCHHSSCQDAPCGSGCGE
jgi:hypothetical protein